MNVHNERVIKSLAEGKVTAHTGFGNSMRPVIYSGQRQTLVPVLSDEEGNRLGAKPFDPAQPFKVGDLFYLKPDCLAVGNAVHCKVGPSIFTHEIISIRGQRGTLEFQIARHDRKRINGWTSTIYGKCVRVED